MRLAIMQPYFLPYIGYFQLIGAVNEFITYDNIKYTKKGWINRNRMLRNGQDVMFTVPLTGASDHLTIVERELAAEFDRAKLLSQFRGAYLRAPFFESTFPLIERVVNHPDNNLFRFLHNSIMEVCAHLGLKTKITVSSTVPIDPGLKNQDMVLAYCKAAGAETYVNAIGGVELYSKDVFREQGIELRFLKSRPFEYAQLGAPFVPWLSILDVLMFNPIEAVQSCIASNYELV
ncbi:MAG: WbqC family protein [Deltaproteobacteria bacterium]|nr:WbqC family protein [Deltaproteobacteria bacterium]